MLIPGPMMEVMCLPNGQLGERIIYPDGEARCWVDGNPADPEEFEQMARRPTPKSSVWRVE